MRTGRAKPFSMFLPILILAAILDPAAQQATVEGRVVDSDGAPIADVRVFSPPWDELRTAADGKFGLQRPAALVRFSKRGYQPLTLVSRSLPSPLVLRRSEFPAWAPGFCATTERRVGEAMLFALPTDVRSREARDVDYRTVAVQAHGTTLVFGAGPHWSYGLPAASTLEGTIELRERDVLTPSGDIAAEYRGQRANGRYWRNLVQFGESVGYDEATLEAAQYFDAIIDSLCFRPPPPCGLTAGCSGRRPRS